MSGYPTYQELTTSEWYEDRRSVSLAFLSATRINPQTGKISRGSNENDELRRERTGCIVSHGPQEYDSSGGGYSGERVRFQGHTRYEDHRPDPGSHRLRARIHVSH